MKIIIDRIEGEYAVCECATDDHKMIDIEISKFKNKPKKGQIYTIENGAIIYDKKATLKRVEYINSIMKDIWE